MNFKVTILSLFVTIFATSCGVNYHIKRAIKKGYRCDSVADTIRITSVDSFPVIVDNKIVYEYYHTTKDTIVRYNTSFVPQTRWQTRIEYKLKRDTIPTQQGRPGGSTAERLRKRTLSNSRDGC